MPEVGDGRTILLWQDVWNNSLSEQVYPCLYTFAKKNVCPLMEYLGNSALNEYFHSPLSPETHEEYGEFRNFIALIQNEMREKDRWPYSWGIVTSFPLEYVI